MFLLNELTISDTGIRLMIFIGVLILCMLVESRYPRKQRVQGRQSRWLTNLSMVAINTLALKLLGPLTALSVAAYSAHQGWGLLAWLELPFWLSVFVAVVLLDFAIYCQHVLSHKVPFLWRLHRVHHVDRDIDVTTGVRFHPIEIMLSMLFKCAMVALLGVPVVAVFLFEILLNASALFNHSNLRLSSVVDHYLRKLIVTPDMHRVHHSIIPAETDSNYGFFLSLWDRLCGTYTAQPKEGHDKMTIGLAKYQTEQPSNMLWCLRFPFVRKR